MDDTTLWLIIAGIAIALFLAWAFVVGAASMFVWAGDEGGGVGCMIMLALWIFAFPVMAVLALIFGIAILIARLVNS